MTYQTLDIIKHCMHRFGSGLFSLLSNFFFQVGRFGKKSHSIGSCTASLQEPIECEFLP